MFMVLFLSHYDLYYAKGCIRLLGRFLKFHKLNALSGRVLSLRP